MQPVEQVAVMLARKVMQAGKRLIIVSYNPGQRAAISKELWRGGEEEALQTLVARVEPVVRRMARQRLGDHLRARLDSADVTQEVLLGFLRSAPDFVVQRESDLLALLATILENHLRGANRFHRRKQRDLDREVKGSKAVDPGELTAGSAARGPSTQAAASERSHLIEIALAQLDPLDRRIVTMRSYEDATFGEIAAALELGEEAVRKRFTRALPRLSRRLQELGEATQG